jgi:hypothetical protein
MEAFYPFKDLYVAEVLSTTLIQQIKRYWPETEPQKFTVGAKLLNLVAQELRHPAQPMIHCGCCSISQEVTLDRVGIA